MPHHARVCGSVSRANDWARVPGAGAVINASMVSVTAQLAVLESMCGESSCDVNEGCPIGFFNKTCQRELEWTRVEKFQLKLRKWFSLRRELAHFGRLNAACLLQGSEICTRTVEAHMLTWSHEIRNTRPAFDDREFPFLRAEGSPAKDLAGRKCGDSLPCLSTLVDPILEAEFV